MSIGRPGRAGCWGIDLGAPGDGGPAAVTALALESARAFVAAFERLCTVAAAHADWLGIDGSVVEVQPVEVEPDGTVHLPAGADLVSGLVLRCSVAVVADASDEPLRVPHAADWRFSAVLAPEEEGPKALDAFVRFCVGIDVWLPETRDPATGAPRPNHEMAARNATPLALALRRWEAATGRPITDMTSGSHPGSVTRYGFEA